MKIRLCFYLFVINFYLNHVLCKNISFINEKNIQSNISKVIDFLNRTKNDWNLIRKSFVDLRNYFNMTDQSATVNINPIVNYNIYSTIRSTVHGSSKLPVNPKKITNKPNITFTTVEMLTTKPPIVNVTKSHHVSAAPKTESQSKKTTQLPRVSSNAKGNHSTTIIPETPKSSDGTTEKTYVTWPTLNYRNTSRYTRNTFPHKIITAKPTINVQTTSSSNTKGNHSTTITPETTKSYISDGTTEKTYVTWPTINYRNTSRYTRNTFPHKIITAKPTIKVQTTSLTPPPVIDENSPKANAKSGTYIGYWSVTRLGTKYASFSGIRFAKPMNQQNRFKWAELVDDSSKIFNAIKEGPDCPQWNIQRRSNAIVGNEDCLYLNIYSPSVSSQQAMYKVKVKKLYPVMFVVPCGHFTFDSGSRDLNGPDYFMDTKEIVLVVVNHRLSVLGFADFRSNKYPSNLGLKDQVVALQWVQRNIKSFGGDPKKVTLQGTSSGSVSVHYHFMSPISKGLFHAGISESGTALAPWALAYPQKSRKVLATVAAKVNCSWALPPSHLDNADTVAECFRNRTPYELLAATRRFDYTFMQLIFPPVIEVTKDRPFIPVDPFDAPEEGVPWLVGQNSDEAGLIAPLKQLLFIPVRYYLTFIEYDAIPYWLNYAETASHPNNVTGQIIKHYTKHLWASQSNVIPLSIKAGGDGIFSHTTHLSLLKHYKGPRYYYWFSYRQTTPSGHFLHNDSGVTHSEEQWFLFIKNGIDVQKQNPKPDGEMSKKVVKLWTNFVKFHNPTPDNCGFPKWKQWDSDTNGMYSLGQNSIEMSTDPKQAVYEFWESLPMRDKMKPFIYFPGSNVTKISQRKNSASLKAQPCFYMITILVVLSKINLFFN